MAESIVTEKRRVFIVDDHPIVRAGLGQLIDREPDLMVCGDAADKQTALESIEKLKPEILIVDISLAGADGLDLLKNIRAKYQALPVLILSMHDEATYAERALRAGANGYIMKQEATELVMVALRRILNREIYVSDFIAGKIARHFDRDASKAFQGSPIEILSDRELEVLRLISAGVGTRQIATRLGLSVKTIETYQGHLKDKLGLKNSRELIQYAIQWAVGEAQDGGGQSRGLSA